MVGGVNNQTPTHGPTHEQKCAHMISKRTFIKNQTNSHLVNDPPKKPVTGDKIEPLSSLKVGFESEQPRVIELGCLIM